MSAGHSQDPGRPPGPSPMDADGFIIPPKRKRGRPRKKFREDDTISVVSSFGSLTDDDPGDDQPTTETNRTPKSKKPPPITLKGIDPLTLQANLKDIKIPKENLSIRMKLDGGANLYVTNNDEFRLLRSYLDSKAIKYFTYTPDDEKLKRYVLYGVPDHDTAEIKKYIHDTIKVEPADVRKMKITKPRYRGHTNYVIYFDKKHQTSLLQMKQISGMFGFHVFWSIYRRTEIPQCYNCQSFFHTSRGCTLVPRCNRCGGKHKTTECSLVDKTTNKVPDDKLVCCHCQGNHTSSFRQCPKRLQILKQHQIQIEQRQQHHSRNRYVTNFRNYDQNFPRMNQNKVNTGERSTHATNAWEIPLQSTIHTRSNSNTFTPSQLFQIFSDIVRICSTHKTKEEQLMALTSIYEKYVMHD